MLAGKETDDVAFSWPCSIPYAPYSKGEKLGRIADWNANAGTAGGPHAFNDPLLAGSQARRFGGRMNANGSQGYREANEDDFSLVDSKAGFVAASRLFFPGQGS